MNHVNKPYFNVLCAMRTAVLTSVSAPVYISLIALVFGLLQETRAQDRTATEVRSNVADAGFSNSSSKVLLLGENGTRRKSLFIEFLGNGGFLTANYDTRLNVDRNDGLGVRVGFGLGGFHFLNFDPLWTNNVKSGTKYASVPFQLNYIVGKRRSGLEAGIGITPEFTLNQKGNDPHVMLTGLLNLGYRLQPIDKGVSLRVVASPGIYQRKVFPIGAGISLGYSFR